MTGKSYAEFDDFAGLLLEESRVRRMLSDERSLKIEAQIAVLGDHPRYEVPGVGEVYSYFDFRLTLAGEVDWITDGRNARVTDDDGVRHMGGFTRCEMVGQSWFLEGPWGAVRVNGGRWTVQAR